MEMDEFGGDRKGLIGVEMYLYFTQSWRGLASMFRVSMAAQRPWGMSVRVKDQLRGLVVSSSEHVTMSTDTFGCHNLGWGVGAEYASDIWRWSPGTLLTPTQCM